MEENMEIECQTMVFKEPAKKTLTIGGINMLAYMMPSGEYRWSMRQASKAVGYNESWLSDTLKADSGALQKLEGYGFKGDYIETTGRGFIESNLISTEDFMAAILYAAVIGFKRPAVARMAASMRETLERRADHVFGVIRDEDEYVQKFEYRYASMILNKDLRGAIGDWIEQQSNLKDYLKGHSIAGGQRGLYATTLGTIYKIIFGKHKKEINQHLDVAEYRTLKDTVHVTQLQRIANVEDLARKYIERKGVGPIEAVEAAAEALMIDMEEPRLGDRVTREDVHKVLGSKTQSR